MAHATLAVKKKNKPMSYKRKNIPVINRVDYHRMSNKCRKEEGKVFADGKVTYNGFLKPDFPDCRQLELD